MTMEPIPRVREDIEVAAKLCDEQLTCDEESSSEID
eukprot:CAMPEP_0201884528 /NCGR_PEP_ID=MMETSP0902-20130614/17391_1 /ASSEMBLY_ACC=CAM_ASM_000551 /TAXON_ID=420261 /ORGANISM="Thalassiosira antarctica, Strain CCMP982" /LENGTH=35 /DNA_ID= /DNA_START= /DNA_END= /DNA_ORIENTATION=